MIDMLETLLEEYTCCECGCSHEACRCGDYEEE